MLYTKYIITIKENYVKVYCKKEKEESKLKTVLILYDLKEQNNTLILKNQKVVKYIELIIKKI